MNQNNDYNFDPMTGQPVQQPVNNIPPQQPAPTQNINTGYTQPPQQPKRNSKVFVVIAILIIAGIVAGLLLFNNEKDNLNNDKSNNNAAIDNNKQNEKNTNSTDNSSKGTVDKNTNTTYDNTGAFLMTIEDVFTISGRGTVVTGQVLRGTLNIGDTVQIVGLKDEIKSTTVTSIEMFRKTQDYAEVGDNVGVVLKDITREEVERGQVLAKPNSIVAAKKFDADVYVLTKEEGGRHTPFFDSFRPQFYFRTTDITGTIKLPDDIAMVNPGDKVSFNVTLETTVAMEVGTEFSIREGGRTVAKGTVTKVY